MDAQTQTLKHELDAALADLEEAATLAEINQTLVDMLEVLKARKSAAPVVNVTNQVHPTPVNVILPSAGHVFTFEYDAKGRVCGGTVTPKGK